MITMQATIVRIETYEIESWLSKSFRLFLYNRLIFGKSAKNLDKKLTIGAAQFIIAINEYCRCEVIEHGYAKQGVASGH